MSSRREYEIAFVGLKPGTHEYEYSVTDSFFESFNEQDFKNCQAHIKLVLEKGLGSFLRLRFEVGGTLEVICDRCSNNLPIQLFDEFVMTVKLVDNPDVMNDQEEDPNVFYIAKGESHLDVKTWIYEFINLSIPMQKTCSFEAMDGPHCNPAARALLSSLRATENNQGNPVWKGLEKFKDLEPE
ncbi:MAG TPA: DUF177 domain-containing protein [Chitinophagaceae bacterium]|nr:DUF177 domain-containing protein [Chitinophagaceae bacterium]